MKYSNYSLIELKQYAKKIKLKGYSKLKKQDLIILIVQMCKKQKSHTIMIGGVSFIENKLIFKEISREVVLKYYFLLGYINDSYRTNKNNSTPDNSKINSTSGNSKNKTYFEKFKLLFISNKLPNKLPNIKSRRLLFNYIISSETLSHISEIEKIFLEISKIYTITKAIYETYDINKQNKLSEFCNNLIDKLKKIIHVIDNILTKVLILKIDKIDKEYNYPDFIKKKINKLSPAKFYTSEIIKIVQKRIEEYNNNHIEYLKSISGISGNSSNT